MELGLARGGASWQERPNAGRVKGGVQEKSPDRVGDSGSLRLFPAVTYSPTRLPLQYHRRWRA
jgi:hypothetical protein